MKKLLHSLLFTIIALISANSLSAQSQVYWREGFNEGEGTMPSSAATSVPGQFISQNNSGSWYIYGSYRTNGATGSCLTETGTLSHVRFANLNAVTTTNDSAYLITPTVNFGINTLTFHNGRASRRFTILKTPDTAATTTNWTEVIFLPATNTACQVFTVTINDPLAKRLKMISRAGTDSDIDSLVLTSTTTILPVTFTALSAVETSGKIKVSWKIATELNTSRYAIERSGNGVSFKEVGSLTATNSGNYNWIDNAPATGNSFYRIRAVDKDGALTYTGIVKINLNKRNVDFIIAPNPVKGSQVNIQVANFSKGNYGVALFNSSGQQVYNKTVNHDGGSSTYQLSLPANLKTGVYNMQLIQGATILSKKLVIE